MSPTSRTLATLTLLFLVGCPKEIPIPVQPPVARKDYAQTPVDTPVTLSPLANDHDPNAEVISVLAIGTPAHGTATIGAGDTVDYTPNLGYTGADSFSVTIVDATGNEVTETAYISVGATTRFLYFSNFEDYFTRQLYLADTLHPGVGIPVNHYLRITKGPNVTESTVETYTLSADRTQVVYLADDSDESNARNAFVVDLTQLGVATQVTDFGVGQGTSAVFPPQLTPDNAFVVYLSNEFNALSLFEPVMVEVANPANRVRLSPALTEDQLVRNPRVTPDGSRLMYVLDDDDVGSATLMVVELATPGVATQISGTPTAGTGGVLDFAGSGGVAYDFVPGTTSVVYPSTEAGATVAELWMVDYVAPAAPVKVSGSAAFVGVISFSIANDGSRVVYASAEFIATQVELFVASLTAPGPATRLNTPQPGTFSLLNYGIGQDSTFMVYTSEEVTAGQRELFRVDFTAPGVAIKLNAPLPTDGDVQGIAFNPADPRMILYTISPDSETPTEQQVLAVDIDVPGTTTNVGPLITSANFVSPLVAPDGESVFYSGDPDFRGVVSIYTLRFDTPTMNEKLTPEHFPGAAVSSVRFVQ